jgi:hypothetical protein
LEYLLYMFCFDTEGPTPGDQNRSRDVKEI